MKTENLHDSELIHYASLSDDPEKRRLAEIASWADRWDKVLGDMLDIDDPEALAEVLDQHNEYRMALNKLGALNNDSRPDSDYLQHLSRLEADANAGHVQRVIDCPGCGGAGFPKLHTLDHCAACKGTGYALQPI